MILVLDSEIANVRFLHCFGYEIEPCLINSTCGSPANLASRSRFGCPISECRKPFLTWHHFDPPLHERQHHDQAGMIALCREHHDAADRGLFSKGELRALKQIALSVEDVKAHFPWAKRGIFVRLGGVYCGGSSNIFMVNNDKIIRFTKDASGLLLFSFRLASRRWHNCPVDGREWVSG